MSYKFMKSSLDTNYSACVNNPNDTVLCFTSDSRISLPGSISNPIASLNSYCPVRMRSSITTVILLIYSTYTHSYGDIALDSVHTKWPVGVMSRLLYTMRISFIPILTLMTALLGSYIGVIRAIGNLQSDIKILEIRYEVLSKEIQGCFLAIENKTTFTTILNRHVQILTNRIDRHEQGQVHRPRRRSE